MINILHVQKRHRVIFFALTYENGFRMLKLLMINICKVQNRNIND